MDQVFQYLDPHNSNYNIDYSAANGIFERLVAFDAEMQIVPQLATGWEASDDALTFALKRRDGMTFHHHPCRSGHLARHIRRGGVRF